MIVRHNNVTKYLWMKCQQFANLTYSQKRAPTAKTVDDRKTPVKHKADWLTACLGRSISLMLPPACRRCLHRTAFASDQMFCQFLFRRPFDVSRAYPRPSFCYLEDCFTKCPLATFDRLDICYCGIERFKCFICCNLLRSSWNVQSGTNDNHLRRM